MIKQHRGWGIYRYVFPSGVAKVVSDPGNGSVYLEYSEGQLYAAECWDANYVWFYNTVDEAHRDFFSYTGRNLNLESSFPSVYRFKNKKVKTLAIHFNVNVESPFEGNVWNAVDTEEVTDILDAILSDIIGKTVN